MGRLKLLLGIDCGCLSCPVCGNLEPHSVKFGEVITVVQKAIPWHPWKNVILQLEVPYGNQGERFPHVEVYEQCPVVAWHGDFGEQVAILHSLGNHQVTPVILPPGSLRQVSMLKQGAADAGVGM